MTEPLPVPAPEPVPEPTGDDLLRQVIGSLVQLAQVVANLHHTIQLVAQQQTAAGVQQAEITAMVHQYRPLLDAAASGPIARGLAGLRRSPKIEVH